MSTQKPADFHMEQARRAAEAAEIARQQAEALRAQQQAQQSGGGR